MIRRPPRSTLFPTRRSSDLDRLLLDRVHHRREHVEALALVLNQRVALSHRPQADALLQVDRKSTRLNSSHLVISYAVFCLKKKKQKQELHYSDSTLTYRLHT